MLSTVIVYVYDHKGARKSCRVLLNCGSQVNFISRKFFEVLGITPRFLNVSISGINNTTTSSNQTVRVKLQSRLNSYSATIECLVADHVTERLPAFTIKRNTFSLSRNLELADPQFNVSAEVDILISADLFWDLLCIGQIKSSLKHPTLQKTRLGWILWILAERLGDSSKPTRSVQSFHTSISNVELHEQLTRFWQLEDFASESNHYTSEESLYEKQFLNSVSQTHQGRYSVKLPFKDEVITKLGDSKGNALKRLYNLERHFKRDPRLQNIYTQFLDEYLSLGHMRLVDDQDDEDSSLYLPHHPVFKGDKQTAKLRVVLTPRARVVQGCH